MSTKAVSILIIICLLTPAQFCRGSVDGKAGSLKKDFILQVYLPREITIKDDTIKLGQVGIIRGEEALVAEAGEILLGRLTMPGQQIVIDRAIVLSRLASNRIPASKVTLTGAEKITVKRQQQIIRGSEFVEMASSLLGKNSPAGSGYIFEPVRVPADLVVPGAGRDIKFSPRFVPGDAPNLAKVRIAVLADGEEIGVREVTCRLKYSCRRVVTLVEIAAGENLSPENVKIEATLSNYPEPAGWKTPYGLIAKRRLPANTVIRSGMVESRLPTVTVARNQTVVIRVERPGLLITALGKAMQKAKAGEFIRVRNMDSQRIILARVKEDGTVEPVL
jgi:flagella basal body P-ring formation protein FlgA